MIQVDTIHHFSIELFKLRIYRLAQAHWPHC